MDRSGVTDRAPGLRHAAQLGPEDWLHERRPRVGIPWRILRPTELEPRRFDEPERKCQNPQYVDETPGDPIDKQLLEAANFEGQSQDHMAPCSIQI